jgi:hypothetical protein
MSEVSMMVLYVDIHVLTWLCSWYSAFFKASWLNSFLWLSYVS